MKLDWLTDNVLPVIVAILLVNHVAPLTTIANGPVSPE